MTGRESREFQCESERKRHSRESGQLFQKRHVFANRVTRIDSPNPRFKRIRAKNALQTRNLGIRHSSSAEIKGFAQTL